VRLELEEEVASVDEEQDDTSACCLSATDPMPLASNLTSRQRGDSHGSGCKRQ
jgi:hypothetical protein